MKNKLLIGLTLLAIGLVIWVFVFPDKEKDKVRVCFPPNLIASLPHWIAMDKGFYTEEGIEISEIANNDSKIMMSSVYSNDADFLPAVSFADFIFSSQTYKNSLPHYIVSHSRFKRDPAFEALLVPNNSNIATLKDLENKKIAVYPGVTSLNAAKYFLTINGVDISNITFMPISPPQHIDFLLKGEADCSHLYEPFKTQAKLNNNMKELYNGVYASFNEPSAFGVSVISSKFYRENPEVAKKLLKIWDKSIRYIREHPDDASQVLEKRLKLSPEVALKAVWVDATLTSEVSEVTLKATAESFNKIFSDSTFEFSSIYLLPK